MSYLFFLETTLMKQDNVAYQKAYAFAIRVVKAYRYLVQEKEELALSKQLLDSGTAIGANIAEANGAISDAEFSAKLGLAYKACLETKYWLSLLKDTHYLEERAFKSIHQDAEEISEIIFTILRTTAKV